MKKDLPKYRITIDPEYSEDGQDLGVSMIAFTKRPAIITKGMAFNSDEPVKLFFKDELKYRICAPVMIPMEIYRSDTNEEYFVQFTEEEIDSIHQKFMSNLTNKDIFNLEHNSEDVMPAFVLEAWIVDTPETDKSFQTYGILVPKGTLMMTTQITDKKVYSDLVSKDQVGYSIEGFLGLRLTEIEINKKNKETKMEENKLNIPAGEYTDKDGNVFIVAEDGTISMKEAIIEEEMGYKPKEEEMACGPKEEEMSIEVDETSEIEETELAEGDVVEEVVTEPIEVKTYTKEEVDAKFDELYKLIGSMKAEEVEVEDEVELVPTQLSINERFEAFNRFYVNSKVEL
jgi:hypothetical protein